MAKLTRIHGWVLLLALLYVPFSRAQETDPAKNDPREQPVAPYPAPLPAGKTSVLVLNSPQGMTEELQIAGNNRPLSGVQEPTLGPVLGASNFLVPSISVVSQMATGYGQPTAFSYLLGTLDLNRVSQRSELLLHYTGGAMISSYLNSAVQDLEFSYSYKWQRWSLLLDDQANYLSESSFGFGGIGGLAFVNGVLEFDPTLNGSLTPSQTIPTIMVPRLSNTAVSQIEYQLSPRSSWTASGSFAMLNFLGAGYINSTQGTAQTGYNYLLSPQSSVAAIYQFNAFRYTYLPQGIQEHLVEFGYARYVTGRLSFHAIAGPSIVKLRGLVPGSANRVSWAANGGVAYQLDRTKLLLSYDRMVTSGSGVLFGAQTSQLEASLERELTPRWQGSAAMGYATNRSLIQPNASSLSQNYNSWYAVVRLHHQLRPGTAFFVSYGARVQAMNGASCNTPNCGTNFISHEISAGFNFGMRPILFR
jgi:hypothetical protein